MKFLFGFAFLMAISSSLIASSSLKTAEDIENPKVVDKAIENDKVLCATDDCSKTRCTTKHGHKGWIYKPTGQCGCLSMGI